MIEKLKSRLASSKGFTLIELLIVIAIIALLVVIVIVAINPVQRLRDAADSSAQSNVRSAATLISTCITKRLADGAAVYDAAGCATAAGPGTALATYGTVPPTTGAAGVTIIANAALSQICAYSDNTSGSGNVRWQSSTGNMENPASAPALSCP